MLWHTNQRNKERTILIEERVLDTIRKVAEWNEPLLPEQSLKNYLGMDSLHIADLAYELEAEFPIHISSRDIENWKTVGDVIAMVRRKLN